MFLRGVRNAKRSAQSELDSQPPVTAVRKQASKASLLPQGKLAHFKRSLTSLFALTNDSIEMSVVVGDENADEGALIND